MFFVRPLKREQLFSGSAPSRSSRPSLSSFLGLFCSFQKKTREPEGPLLLHSVGTDFISICFPDFATSPILLVGLVTMHSVCLSSHIFSQKILRISSGSSSFHWRYYERCEICAASRGCQTSAHFLHVSRAPVSRLARVRKWSHARQAH